MFAKDQAVETRTGLVFQFVPPVTVETVKAAMLQKAKEFGVVNFAIAIVSFHPSQEASVHYKVVGRGDERFGVHDSRTHLSVVESLVSKAVRQWQKSGKLPVNHIDTGDVYLSAFASCDSSNAAFNITLAGLR